MQNISISQLIADVTVVLQTHVDTLLALAACVYILLQFKEAKPSKIKFILVKIAETYFAIKEAFISVRAERKAHVQRLKEADDEFNNMFSSIMYRSRYEQLLKEYNDLVRRINDKGGETFLKHGSVGAKGLDLTQDDLKIIIQLCHPDRHGGKESAVEITKKLLLLRT